MKPLRIAIAEDNWFVAEHLRAELIAFGHTVVGLARTGEELIELVARERPDLALVDFRLAGGSDGLAAAREVEERFAVPAIASTGQPAAAEARAAGLLGFLAKPYTPLALQAMLEDAADWLKRGTARPFLSR